MDDKKMLYRPALLLQYRSGRSANEAHRFIQDAMKEQAHSRATCFNWYRKFDDGDLTNTPNQDTIYLNGRSERHKCCIWAEPPLPGK
ncbi:unnamed protein product [Heligmosomoides polygyrus]|uniref:HTH_48 domain-containing protein n=1 Tax=Heligmosomoides polygyrus TaxID=6339 RepID=A0A183F679_HELPZ|nr:unnamed protein product [Heligmosomoides polygyrus]